MSVAASVKLALAESTAPTATGSFAEMGPELGRGVGKGIRNFKESIGGDSKGEKDA